MGYSSQSGQVILRSQTVAGTYNADTGSAGIGVKLKGGSLGSNRELLIPDAEIGGGRDVVDAYLGAISFSGDYELYGRVDAAAILLKAALGTAAAPATVTGVTTHTITPTDSGTLPLLSIEEGIGGSLEVFHYNDCVVNTLHFECDANGYLMMTAGLIGIMQVAGATKTATPVYDENPMIVGTNVTITYNGVSLPAKNFSLDINNNVEDSDYRLGSFYLGDLTAKRREITAGFGIRESSSAMWRQATYGLPAATQAGGLATKDALVITCQTYESIAGGTPSTPNSLVFTIPKGILTPYSLSPSGDDIIESDITLQAVRPLTATPIITAVVKTAKATIA